MGKAIYETVTHLLRHRHRSRRIDHWICLRCGREGRKQNIGNWPCGTMSYARRLFFLKNRKTDDDIYTIGSCPICEKPFFKLVVDKYRERCYDC